MSQLEPGQRVLERYIIEEYLGEGTLSQLYRARHERLGYVVELKVLSEDASAEVAARFNRSARLMARIRHPNVVSILDYSLDPERPCVALEYVQGETLAERGKRAGPMNWQDALELYIGVLDGLDAVHAASILHRNLQASSIVLLTGSSGETRVKIVDLALAKAVGKQRKRITIAGSVVGTPVYMSPEQLLDNIADPRSDIYAAGLVFYEVLTGNLPFQNKLIERCRRLPPPPEAPTGLQEIPQSLVQVIMDSLAIEPHERPQSVRELVNRLRGLQRRTMAGRIGADQNADGGSVDATSYESFRVALRSPTDPALVNVPNQGTRAIMAASLPPAALLDPDIRDYLAAVQGPEGDSFVVGGHFWVAVVSAADAAELSGTVLSVGESIRRRFDEPVTFEWQHVDEQFRISPASFVGAAPPPVEILQLLAKVARS